MPRATRGLLLPAPPRAATAVMLAKELSYTCHASFSLTHVLSAAELDLVMPCAVPMRALRWKNAIPAFAPVFSNLSPYGGSCANILKGNNLIFVQDL